jgi:hypothetical protein
MSWNHGKFTSDDRQIVPQGHLAYLNLEKAIGYYCSREDKFHSGLENWNIIPTDWVEKYGKKPVTMIFDLDITETYYKIAINGSFFWFRFELVEPI